MNRPAVSPASTATPHLDAALQRLYLPEEVAAVLGCSVWWVKDRARRRLIPFTRVGRAYRFSDDHLAEIVRMHEERPTHNLQRPSGTAVPARKPATRQRTEGAQPVVRLKARPPRRLGKAQYSTAA